jgi:hypothetical protein
MLKKEGGLKYLQPDIGKGLEQQSAQEEGVPEDAHCGEGMGPELLGHDLIVDYYRQRESDEQGEETSWRLKALSQ